MNYEKWMMIDKESIYRIFGRAYPSPPYNPQGQLRQEDPWYRRRVNRTEQYDGRRWTSCTGGLRLVQGPHSVRSRLQKKDLLMFATIVTIFSF